jgi:ribosomal subunit interface protein
MTFPTISYKFNGIEEAKSLTELVDQKIGSLKKIIKDEAVVVCEVEFEKASAHTHGKVYRVEVNLAIDGHLYRAEATEHTYEEAIDRVRDELDGELSRAKDKQLTLEKNQGRILKEQLQQVE